jgi:hypothetical protein
MNSIKYPKIVIGFSRSKSAWKIGSQAIQISEKRNYGHAYIRYQDSLTDEKMIAQASHGFVNETQVDTFLLSNLIVKEYEFVVSEDKFIEVMRFIKKNLGKPYSQCQIICIALKKVLGIKVDIHNKDQAFICSEFGLMIAELLLDKKSNAESDYETPSDLDFLLESNKCNRTFEYCK